MVAELRRRGYVTMISSSTNRREKVVRLTPRAIEYITARRPVVSAFDAEIRARVGDTGLDELLRLLCVVAETEGSTTGFDSCGLIRPTSW
jgi:DNA-binding MarR family transcriptional regulator